MGNVGAFRIFLSSGRRGKVAFEQFGFRQISILRFPAERCAGWRSYRRVNVANHEKESRWYIIAIINIIFLYTVSIFLFRRYLTALFSRMARVYHYKARAYSPTLGRFLQADPVGYEDNLDLYAYVGDDPLDRADPSGNAGITISADYFSAAMFPGDDDNSDKRYDSGGVAIGFHDGKIELATYESHATGIDGAGVGVSGGAGFYNGSVTNLSKTTDTAGGAVLAVTGSGSYVGDKHGVPTGKGPIAGAIPAVAKTPLKHVGVGVGLGVYHAKTTTTVHKVSIGLGDIQKAASDAAKAASDAAKQAQQQIDRAAKSVCSATGIC